MEGLREEAMKLFEEAYKYHMLGDLDKAIELYRKSIDVYPTAEAWTFLGWAYSMRGNYEGAIEACKKAIEIDPDFGNPYNDIGSYLIELGQLDEAIEWLEKAKRAKRYEPRHYPYINLAKVYMLKGKLYDALREIEEAIKIRPDYKPAHMLRHQILGMLN
ncbi:tetratricopeptide repeat protein [Aquifex sp.]